MRSDYTAVKTAFKITVIKFTVTEKIVKELDWKLVGYHKTTNGIFKNRLSMYVDGRTTYSDFNKYIL